MSNENPNDKKEQMPEADAPGSRIDDVAPTAEATANDTDDAGSNADRIAALETEIAELKNQHLRDLAEMENVRRRAQRDRDEAAKFGSANFARDLLTVADNLRRALESVPEEVRKNEAVSGLVQGVELVERELLRAFEKQGIQKIEPAPGDRFDHNLHQAMFELENTGLASGSIAQVMQPGYRMHERLLRAAMVGVAKGEPASGERVDTVA